MHRLLELTASPDSVHADLNDHMHAWTGAARNPTVSEGLQNLDSA
jgi:hypothetical protein